VKDAAQALGLRPWLAALPLRERRLRARLLMLCSKMGLSVIRGKAPVPHHCGILSRRGVTWCSWWDELASRPSS